MGLWSLRCGLFGNLMSVAVDPYKLAVPLLRAWGFGGRSHQAACLKVGASTAGPAASEGLRF